MHFLNAKDMKPLLAHLRERFGLTEKLDGIYHKNSKGKVYFASRVLEPVLSFGLRVKALGIYIGQWDGRVFRFSLEGSQLFGPLCTSGVVDFSDEELDTWLSGAELSCSDVLKGYYLARFGGAFAGCGRADAGVFRNFVSRSRQVKPAQKR